MSWDICRVFSALKQPCLLSSGSQSRPARGVRDACCVKYVFLITCLHAWLRTTASDLWGVDIKTVPSICAWYLLGIYSTSLCSTVTSTSLTTSRLSAVIISELYTVITGDVFHDDGQPPPRYGADDSGHPREQHRPQSATTAEAAPLRPRRDPT